MALVALVGGCQTAEDSVALEVRNIVASQYNMQPVAVDINRPFRDYGRETGLQDEMNYVEVIQRIEDKFKVHLPDDRVMNKSKVGIEFIPFEATPKWLTQIVRERLGNPGAH